MDYFLAYRQVSDGGFVVPFDAAPDDPADDQEDECGRDGELGVEVPFVRVEVVAHEHEHDGETECAGEHGDHQRE